MCNYSFAKALLLSALMYCQSIKNKKMDVNSILNCLKYREYLEVHLCCEVNAARDRKSFLRLQCGAHLFKAEEDLAEIFANANCKDFQLLYCFVQKIHQLEERLFINSNLRIFILTGNGPCYFSYLSTMFS